MCAHVFYFANRSHLNFKLNLNYEGPREATGGGGGEWEPNQILLQELSYVPSLIPKAKTLQ
jgi:hypothetical protein